MAYLDEEGLTPKQARFAAEVAIDEDHPTDCAMRAGYASGNRRALAVTACRLMQNPAVLRAIERERQKVKNVLKITPVRWTQECQELRDRAAKDKHHAAAIRAQELIGRVAGVFRGEDGPGSRPQTLAEALATVQVNVTVLPSEAGRADIVEVVSEEVPDAPELTEGEPDA